MFLSNLRFKISRDLNEFSKISNLLKLSAAVVTVGVIGSVTLVTGLNKDLKLQESHLRNLKAESVFVNPDSIRDSSKLIKKVVPKISLDSLSNLLSAKLNKTHNKLYRRVDVKKYLLGRVKYHLHIDSLCEASSIDPLLIYALISYESGWNHESKNSNCYGLMQVKHGSINPHRNIEQGIEKYYKYSQLIEDKPNNRKTFNSQSKVLESYNKGIAGFKKHLKMKGKMTYSKDIMDLYLFYKSTDTIVRENLNVSNTNFKVSR